MMHGCFGRQLHFHFQAQKHLTWWTPYIKLFTVTGYHTNINLLRSCPRAITGKWQLKNEKLTAGLKNKNWKNLQIKNHKRVMNSH
jgi:hypothetical protein